MAMPNPSKAWEAGHPWATVYDFFVERESLARVAGRLAFGTDTRLLYDAMGSHRLWHRRLHARLHGAHDEAPGGPPDAALLAHSGRNSSRKGIGSGSGNGA